MIELKAELSQIPWQMFLINRVIGSVHSIFNVAYHGVNPLKVRELDALRTTTCDNSKMKTIGFFNTSETGQSIRDNQG